MWPFLLFQIQIEFAANNFTFNYLSCFYCFNQYFCFSTANEIAFVWHLIELIILPLPNSYWIKFFPFGIFRCELFYCYWWSLLFHSNQILTNQTKKYLFQNIEKKICVIWTFPTSLEPISKLLGTQHSLSMQSSGDSIIHPLHLPFEFMYTPPIRLHGPLPIMCRFHDHFKGV